MKFPFVKLFLAIILPLCGLKEHLFAQDNKQITLEQLQSMAMENYPLLKQKQLIDELQENRVSQLKTNLLPQVSVVGQATYQSEVTSFNFPLPGASGFSQKPDQYSVGLELKQQVFDYGAIRTLKQLEKDNASVQIQQVEIEYQKLKDRINQLYGNICLQQENKNIIRLRMEELNAKRMKMQSAYENGAALKSSFLVLDAEYLLAQQKMEEVNANLNAWFQTLSIITNKFLDTSFVISKKNVVVLQQNNNRPELKMYDLQSNALQLKESMIFKNNLPKLFVFGRGYYGRPGFNFINNDFRPYALAGVGLSWNLTSYYTASKEKKNLKINNSMIANQRELFDINLRSILVQQTAEIEKLEKMIEMDSQIVEAKQAIRLAASSQLDNGVITASDYIVELNAENQALFNKKLHEIQLMMAHENYNNTLGY
jgi:outer membrane protein TolC